MLLALLSEFAVAPRIVARENLRLWHSVGTLMYAVQWVCAGITLAKVNSMRTSS
jgi:phosphatidylserine synthase